MNGARHYREAERELERANQSELGVESEYHQAKAQVHATLALACAQIDIALGATGGMDQDRRPCDADAWIEVTS